MFVLEENWGQVEQHEHGSQSRASPVRHQRFAGQSDLHLELCFLWFILFINLKDCNGGADLNHNWKERMIKLSEDLSEDIAVLAHCHGVDIGVPSRHPLQSPEKCWAQSDWRQCLGKVWLLEQPCHPAIRAIAHELLSLSCVFAIIACMVQHWVVSLLLGFRFHAEVPWNASRRICHTWERNLLYTWARPFPHRTLALLPPSKLITWWSKHTKLWFCCLDWSWGQAGISTMVCKPFNTDGHLGDSHESDVIIERSGIGYPEHDDVWWSPWKGGELVFWVALLFNYRSGCNK